MSMDNKHGYIVRTPGVLGGKPRLDGHRIAVQHIAIEYEWQGLCPEEIREQHPGLTLAQVHAALAYFFDHRDEILAESDEKLVEECLRKHPDGSWRG